MISPPLAWTARKGFWYIFAPELAGSLPYSHGVKAQIKENLIFKFTIHCLLGMAVQKEQGFKIFESSKKIGQKLKLKSS